MRRLVSPGLLLYLALFGLCLTLAAASGCGGNQRQQTLRATLVSLNAARDGFVELDATRQRAITDKAATREEGEQALAAYRLKRTPIVASFEVAYRVLAAAATQSDEPSYRAALAAAADLLDALKSLTGGP